MKAKTRKRRTLRVAGRRLHRRATAPPKRENRERGVLVGGVHDPAEKTADHAAEQVMAGNKVTSLAPATAAVHRACADCEEEKSDKKEKTAKRSARGAPGVASGAKAGRAGSKASAAIRAMGPGKPLARADRTFFEPRFGRDLSSVRIHDDPAADRAARSIDARAFAWDSDIAFARGQYRPESQDGRRTLAHEIAHTLQEETSAVRRQAHDEDPNEIQMPEDYAGKSLTMRPAEMCGPNGCFTDERIYAGANRSLDEDAAAEARAKAERKRRRDIMRHGTKQQKWQLEFETRYYDLKGVGAVMGTRDEGTMTPAGVRVPKVKGDFLSPRPFYEGRSAALLAWQGFIHYAELAEAGHGPAAAHMSMNYGGRPIPDNQLDLARYTRWSYKAKETREAVQSAILVAEGAGALQRALIPSASSTFASNLVRIAGKPRAVTGEVIMVEGVAFQGVRVTRKGDELFVGVEMIERLKAAPGQGKAMWVELERGALEAGRNLGAKTVFVAGHNVQNPKFLTFLIDRGYKAGFIDYGPGYWTKVLKP